MNGAAASTYTHKLMNDVARGQYFISIVAGIQPLCPVSTRFLSVYFRGAKQQSVPRSRSMVRLCRRGTGGTLSPAARQRN